MNKKSRQQAIEDLSLMLMHLTRFLNGLSTDESAFWDEFSSRMRIYIIQMEKILCCWDLMYCWSTADKGLLKNWFVVMPEESGKTAGR